MYKRKRSSDIQDFSFECWVRRRKLEMSRLYRHEFCALPQCEAENKRQDFMYCGRCRVVVYCCREHQKAHYRYHKSFCKENEWKINQFSSTAASLCPLPNCNCKEWQLSSVTNKPLQKCQTSADDAMQVKVSEVFHSAASIEENPIAESSLNNQDFNSLNSDFKKLFHNSHLKQSESQLSTNTVPTKITANGIIMNAINGSNNRNDNKFSRPHSYEQESTNSTKKRVKKSNLRKQSSPKVSLNGECNSITKAINKMEADDDLENYAPQCDEVVAVSDCESHSLTSDGNSNGEVNVSVNVVSSLSSSLCASNSVTKQDKSISGDGFVPGNIISPSKSNTLTVSSSSTIPFQHRNNLQPLAGQTPQQNRAWMFQICQQIIEDMDRFGVCVVDNLLGETRGAAVLREVQSMYSSGAFTDGQLVKGQRDAPGASQSIRGDKITWVDGREPHCRNISILVKLLDNIIMGANSLGNNGKLGNYRIKERSKAMVACYPGSGTQYVKHVDNPNDDGRCVTAIYYLNKDWNTKENGGLLRIFPEGWHHEVADIEPLFDRVIFFWSDRRNPHEVQPAFKTRYAITLWYFDSNAKEQAKIRNQMNTSTTVKAAS